MGHGNKEGDLNVLLAPWGRVAFVDTLVSNFYHMKNVSGIKYLIFDFIYSNVVNFTHLILHAFKTAVQSNPFFTSVYSGSLLKTIEVSGLVN